MKLANFGYLLLIATLCIFANQANCESTEAEVIKSYSQFTWKYLAKISATFFNFKELSNVNGISVSSPFVVGNSLALIYQYPRLFNVSTQGISQLLISTVGKNVSEYQILINIFKEESIRTKSKLFLKFLENTSEEIESHPRNDIALELIKFNKWDPPRQELKDYIGNLTTARLAHEFLPTKGNILGDIFYPFTTGFLLNTLQVRSKWQTSVKSIGLRKFQDGTEIPYLETEGSFPVYHGVNFTAVKLILQKGTTLGLIMPNGSDDLLFNEVLAEIVDLGSNSTNVSTVHTKVQFPMLNISTAGQSFGEVTLLGVDKTFCEFEGNDNYSDFVAPIAVQNLVQFTEQGIDLSTASGLTVNSKKLWEEFINGDGNKRNEFEVRRKKATSKKNVEPELIAHSRTENVITFDKQFMWYVEDKKIGQIYFGIVSSFKAYKKQQQPQNPDDDFAWLYDTFKISLWNCQ